MRLGKKVVTRRIVLSLLQPANALLLLLYNSALFVKITLKSIEC
jgi:hypothetical protein